MTKDEQDEGDVAESTPRSSERHPKDLTTDGFGVAQNSPPKSRARRGFAKRTIASWCRQLERNGFTSIEAKRIVFEKAHPRGEGLARV